jgi:hypothetical protein
VVAAVLMYPQCVVRTFVFALYSTQLRIGTTVVTWASSAIAADAATTKIHQERLLGIRDSPS